MVGFEYDSIFNYDSFDESAILANVVTHTIVSTQNEKLGSNIKEIETGYVDSFIGSGENLFFIESSAEQDQGSPLECTLNKQLITNFGSIYSSTFSMMSSSLQSNASQILMRT